MRECKECTACCSWLIGDAFGWKFGCSQSCRFLEEGGCGVHKARPDKCNVLVSVEQNENGQYLKAVGINNKKISTDIKDWFIKWGEKMNTPILIVE